MNLNDTASGKRPSHSFAEGLCCIFLNLLILNYRSLNKKLFDIIFSFSTIIFVANS